MTGRRIFCLDPATYESHSLHDAQRDWSETNCYIDVWVETIHALGLDAYAMLPFTIRSDFEDDQWTFFKPPHSELDELYGLDVQELTLWRPLVTHCVEQTAHRKLVFVEMDAFYLPDTAGTDYKEQHTKTTIVVVRIDAGRRWLGYFHNRGYHELEGDDFDGLFKTGVQPADRLAPYAEFVRLDRLIVRPNQELVRLSLTLLARHLERIPLRNPLLAWADRFPQDLDWLLERDLSAFHSYVFAGARQCGSSFDLAAHYVRWLADNGQGHGGLIPAADSLAAVSTGCKALILKLARTVNRRRRDDLTPDIRALAPHWDSGMEALRKELG